MKKWILPILILLLLTACNASTQNNEQGQASEDYQGNIGDQDQNEGTHLDDENSEEDMSTSENTNKDEDAESTTGNKENQEEPQYILNLANSSFEPIGDANPDVVLLTIDDAPDRYALEMATTLKELNVKAIFFVNGHFLQTKEEQALLKEIYEMGFPIGNHTMNHKNLNQQTEEEQYAAIVGLSDLIEEIIGQRPKFFRAPFGENTDYSNDLVAKEGMVRMNWTYGYDWEKEYTSAKALADIMVNTNLLKSGANLLMHDREWTNEALREIVKGLQEKGYEMVDPDLIEVPSGT
ncbi:polysaccharide deacetylase family protein [Sutcliffiella halmapala]|uniref:polysaccharide deacetylase family protein n=1 Tax=Sutcliffiella halmapala TaxID=79882 RepID=UPI0009955804|nr:polysaccharide deacetylase family protein [Sutcliffiella halmapala]